MTLSASESRRFVEEWVGQQRDIPTVRAIIRRKYHTMIRAREFSVLTTRPPGNEQFLLVKLYVYDDGSVKVKQDRRSQVKAIFENCGVSLADLTSRSWDHVAATNCFISAAEARTQDTPACLKCISRVDRSFKGAGADACAKIQAQSSDAEIEVLVKVVTSKSEKSAFSRDLPPTLQHRTIVIAVTPYMSAKEIQQVFYQYVTEMRRRLS